LNPSYITTNITPDTFSNLGINFFIITDNSGQVTAAYGYDLIKNETLSLSAEFLERISKIQILYNSDLKTESAGFILVNNEPILLAYHPILTSLSDGPPHGILTIGRFLGDGFAARLSDTTQLSIKFESYKNADLDRELQTAKQIPGSEPAVSIKILSPETVAGYMMFQDVFGDPTIILRTAMDRDIYTHGYNTILFFIYVVFFGSLSFFITAVYLFDRLVISRISSLSKSVIGVHLSGDLADRVPVKGKDELSSLANEINEMLRSLEVADYKLRHSRDELEKLIEDRTEELVQVNLDLKHEINEHELGRKALSEAYNEIHLIISSISSMMVGVDNNGLVTLWNNVAGKMLGLSSSDVIGLDFFSLPIHWNWEAIIKNAAECVKNNRNIRMDDVMLENQAEQTRILGITLTPLMLKDKEHPGFLLIGADITERRLLEQQVVQSNKLEAIGRLAAGVAHEINTPTQLVGSNLRFLGEQLVTFLMRLDPSTQPNEALMIGTSTHGTGRISEKDSTIAQIEYFRQEAPKAIEQSLEGIERISHIVNAMRYFTHPGGENKEIANLNQIIQNAISLSRNEWKNVAEIKTELEADLPNVECLPIELSQVVLNTIMNAIHAIQDALDEQPEKIGQIVITSRQLGELIEMRITDNGTGIPKEIQNKIFDPFYTTKDIGRGTGQGLAIAYTVIVKKHGGTLEFESEVGRGTSFIIHLPRKAAYE
jgi:PAS domain S-box-containing protein